MKKVLVLFWLFFLVLNIWAQKNSGELIFDKKSLSAIFTAQEIDFLQHNQEVVRGLFLLDYPTYLGIPIQTSAVYNRITFKNVNGVIKKTSTTTIQDPRRNNWGLTFFWIIVPFAALILMLYYFFKDNQKNNVVKIWFMPICMFLSMIAGWTGGFMIGFSVGVLVGACPLIFPRSNFENCIIFISVGLSGFAGYFAGQTNGPTSPESLILWRYLEIIFLVSLLAFSITYVINRKRRAEPAIA